MPDIVRQQNYNGPTSRILLPYVPIPRYVRITPPKQLQKHVFNPVRQLVDFVNNQDWDSAGPGRKFKRPQSFTNQQVVSPPLLPSSLRKFHPRSNRLAYKLALSFSVP